MNIPARFFRCLCGKLHCNAGLDSTTRCPKCGIHLWKVAK